MKKNTIYNLLSSVIPMSIGIIAVPFLIKKMGIESFGVLSIIWTFIGYFSIFDFGIGRALTQQVSHLKEEREKMISVIKLGLLLMLITGIIGGVLLALFVSLLDISWLKISKNLYEDTIFSLLIASIGIPLTTVTTGLKGVLEGFEDFYSVSLLKMFLGILNFLFPIFIVYYFGNSLKYVVLSIVISRLLIMLLHIYPVLEFISIKEFYNEKMASKDDMKKTLSFGVWMTISNIISPLMVNSDRFFISSVLGASFIAYYTVPFDIIIRLLVIPAALTTTLFPRFSFLFRNDLTQLKKLYNKSLLIVLLSMGIVSIGLIIFSYLGLKLWINENFAMQSWKIVCVLAIGLVFNSLSQVPYALIQAKGDVKLTTTLHVIEFILYVPLLLIFMKMFGILGVSLAWSIRVIIDYLFLTYFSNKKMKLLIIHD